MDEKIREKFMEMQYNAVANLFDDLTEKLNDIYADGDYKDAWLAALYDGIVEIVNIFLGELYGDRREELTEVFEQMKMEFESKYTKPHRATLNALLTVLATYDTERFDIFKMREPESETPTKRVNVAYM